MERKSMGAFIAALRKASGMTQKELAEKLNVSDKSVSRWERDDGAPDLSLIPVIAEVFGVTCDELLRGERRTEAQPAESSPKGEKVCKRILALSLARYRNRTLIAMGISVLGLIAAMIGNLGFLRAYIGFFAGAVFYVAAAICQAIFINGAFLSVDDDSLDGEGSAAFRGRVISMAKVSFGLTLVLFAATLPLVVYVHDTYWGLDGGDWLQFGLIFGVIALVLWCIGCYFGSHLLLKNGFITMDEQAERKYRHNRKLALRCLAGLLVIAFVTLQVQSFVNNVFSAWKIRRGTEFQDYDSFVAYMEEPVSFFGGESGTVIAVPEDGIAEDYIVEEEVRIADGTVDGKVVCTFAWLNGQVQSYRTSDTEDGLPIIAYSSHDHYRAELTVQAYNIGFAVLYLVEIAGTAVMYLRKREK